MTNIAAGFFNRARALLEAPAVSFRGTETSFGKMADRVRRLACSLRRMAGGPGERILLSMENRPEFLELALACWTAGLTAVPTNARLHPKETAQIAADCTARAVFTSETLGDGIASELSLVAPKTELSIVGGSAWRKMAEAPAIDCADVSPEDTAWLFYTSGTTGRAKGAMLSHRTLLFMAFTYLADIEHMEAGDVMLHAAPLSHGSGLYALPHLLAGGHQVILPGFDAAALLEGFTRYRNVSLFAAPTMVTHLLQAAHSGAGTQGLRTLIYGGGPMYVSDLLSALDRFGPRLYQLYGQGESPMTITGLSQRDHIGDGGAEHRARLGSSGPARTGVEVRVVDNAGRDLPADIAGEVITRSDCVMSGYWGNPEATAAALRDGWLWTGDIGSLDARGYLTLKDRSKDLVISGGANIYPREIEEVLLRHPAVIECSVVGRPHAEWGEEVIAFIVSAPGATLAAAELDALCLANIARFKRPRGYRFVASLPKNNYGKVLKTSLRAALSEQPCAEKPRDSAARFHRRPY
ncbi:MAG: AMP-binding protein [Acetobacteraceae bacterium]